jgi:hypothetical protein
MDQMDYETKYQQKYMKYLIKNKLLLKQLERYAAIDEQEVRFIGITIENISESDEDDIMDAIINENDTHKFNILKTLKYIKTNYLKYAQLKKYHRNLRQIVQLKHDQLYDSLDNILKNIRGENTLLNFELAYSDVQIDFADPYKKIKRVKRFYILELLPPDKHEEHNFNQYKYQNNKLQWDLNDRNNINTLKYKWMSENHSWKWDQLKKVWVTNDVRPWYFTNYPSKDYIRSVNEWDDILTEIIEEEKMNQKILMNERMKKPVVTSQNGTLFDKIKSFFSKDKIHVINDKDTDTTADITL